MRPDTDDARGDDNAASAPQDGEDMLGQTLVGATWKPDGAVAEIFKLR